ncbi:MAG TPA: protease inhibitor I42 family protein [Candidatus Omnitrophota bacterium]|nr:protease inhibitor I42 family protein [Candidatus Omnitrophota bacterium]
MKRFFVLILVFFLFCPAASRGEVSPLEIEAFPDQSTVQAGTMFLVHMRVVNPSPDSSTQFWAYSCSYEKHWITDNPEVLIQPWTCDENSLEEVPLGPGEAYEKDIMLHIPGKDQTGTLTFHLGFKRMSENGDVAEPLWSDPVTMKVIVPEEMKEESSGVTTVPPEGTQPRVFEDSSVSIQVRVGEEFSISLTSNPSTGYSWRMTLPENDTTVRSLGSEFSSAQTDRVGAPGKEIFKFKALNPGETKADFIYRRSWEAETDPPRETFTIIVSDN